MTSDNHYDTHMTTYLALFRGINIGGHHKLPMHELVQLCHEEGCRNIQTYIQSGNVIFDTKEKDANRLIDNIQHAIAERFGFSPSILLLTQARLQSAMQENPFPTSNGKALSLLFLTTPPDKPDIDGIRALKGRTEQYLLTDRVFYLYAPDGFGRSRLADKVEKLLGVAVTGRNWNTVSRLAAMLELREKGEQ
nr:hypothetical protein 11 [Gammaproteobacteria bacterium]